MNATQTLITEALENSTHGATVAELVIATGKGETTIRENLKKLIESGDVSKNGKTFGLVIPEPVEVEVEDEAGPEIAAIEADKPAEPTAPAADAKPRKKYQRHDKPQTRTTRVNQISKCEVGVRKTDESPRDGITTKWYTICLTHDVAHGEEKLKDAHAFSTYPTFCPTARPLLEGKIGRRRKGGQDAVAFVAVP